eukprot:305473_1
MDKAQIIPEHSPESPDSPNMAAAAASGKADYVMIDNDNLSALPAPYHKSTMDDELDEDEKEILLEEETPGGPTPGGPDEIYNPINNDIALQPMVEPAAMSWENWQPTTEEEKEIQFEIAAALIDSSNMDTSKAMKIARKKIIEMKKKNEPLTVPSNLSPRRA